MNFQFKKEKKPPKISNFKFQISNSQHGFTLVEIVIAIAIISVVSVVGFVSLFKYRGAQNLKLTANEIIVMIRDTQKKSVTQQDGKRWGMRFENATSGIQKVSIFNGTAFGLGSTTQTSTFRRGILFGSPHPSSTYDFLFTPIEGMLSENKIITLTTNTSGDPVADIIMKVIGNATVRIESDLVGYWHFDEGVNVTAYDASGFNNYGTLTNGPTWQSGTPCKAGGCLKFNGTSNYVSIPPPNLPSYTTVAGWFKRVGAPGAGYHIVFMQGTQIEISIPDGTGEIRTGVTTATQGRQVFNSGSGLTDGNWHFVALTYDGTKLISYIDGKQTATNSVSGALSTGSETNIGYFTGGYYANGYIDEVRIYNRALSADEIKTIYEDLK